MTEKSAEKNLWACYKSGMTQGFSYRRIKYPYELLEPLSVVTSVRPGHVCAEGEGGQHAGTITLEPSGRLTLSKGWRCDGPSGPTFDTEDFMRGAFAHDALYRLIEIGQLGEEHRQAADNTLVELCRQDGMPMWRRIYVWVAVCIFGGAHVKKRK